MMKQEAASSRIRTCSTNNDSSNGFSHEYLRLPLADEANAKSRGGSAVEHPAPQRLLVRQAHTAAR